MLIRCSRGAHEALTCVIVEGEEVVEERVDGGKSESNLKRMFVAPPGARMRGHARARRARPHIRARRLARLTPFKTARSEGSGRVSMQSGPLRVGLGAGESCFGRGVHLRGQISRAGGSGRGGT